MRRPHAPGDHARAQHGFFYVLDRETGELISAKPYVMNTWAKSVDMKTGGPVLEPESALT